MCYAVLIIMIIITYLKCTTRCDCDCESFFLSFFSIFRKINLFVRRHSVLLLLSSSSLSIRSNFRLPVSVFLNCVWWKCYDSANRIERTVTPSTTTKETQSQKTNERKITVKTPSNVYELEEESEINRSQRDQYH